MRLGEADWIIRGGADQECSFSEEKMVNGEELEEVAKEDGRVES